MPMMSTRADMSNIPTGGITRRIGASTGSVRSRSRTAIDRDRRARTDREPRQQRAREHDEPVDREQDAEELTGSRAGRSIQASSLEPLLLFLGDLDVRGREQEHLIRRLRHRAAEGVRRARSRSRSAGAAGHGRRLAGSG